MADAILTDNRPTTDDFTKVEHRESAERISRPSLSYWQDAWRRLKKNRRALISLYIIIALAVFTLLGPLAWRMDPSIQDLSQISQPPSFAKTATVVAPIKRWVPVRLEDFLPAPKGLRLLDDPTTQRVRLVWDPVKGAGGYNVYRNQRIPLTINDLGLPLGGTLGGNEVSYQDRLNLEQQTYYYSVVPTDGYDESSSHSSPGSRFHPGWSLPATTR